MGELVLEPKTVAVDPGFIGCSARQIRRPFDARQSAIATWLLVLGAW
jgi:hypothetical protein